MVTNFDCAVYFQTGFLYRNSPKILGSVEEIDEGDCVLVAMVTAADALREFHRRAHRGGGSGGRKLPGDRSAVLRLCLHAGPSVVHSSWRLAAALHSLQRDGSPNS